MRVLFSPLASHGFVYPMIGMARWLERHGHATAFVTDLSFARELDRHGCARIPRSAKTDGASFVASEWAEASRVAIQVKHLEHALERFRPDLIVGLPLTLGALIAAERTGLPIALLGFCTYLWPASQEVLENPANERERRLTWRLQEWTRLYNEARKLFRLPPVSALVTGTPALGDVFMVRNIPGFGLDGPDMPPGVAFVGDCLWEPRVEDPELDLWLDQARESGKPIVYVQLPRFIPLAGLERSLGAAVESLDLRLAVSTSRPDREIGGPSPRVLARPFLPQERILKHSDLLVTAANTTAVLGAVTAGVPALLIPMGGEQPDVAEWCEEMGIGRALYPPETVTGETIVSSLREILGEPSYRQQAQQMSTRFSSYRGFERATSALLGCAPRRSHTEGRL